MGRPRKSDLGPVPTRERLLQKALELFSERGFDAVSVRDITKPLGLTEGTLYVHYAGKEALLDAIFQRLEERLIGPGFSAPDPDPPPQTESFDLADHLMTGARRFFRNADRETLLTWRLLMITQYRYTSARAGVEAYLLNAPVRHFTSMLQTLQEAGLVRTGLNIDSAGRTIAAVFFQFSFRANLNATWGTRRPRELEELERDLRFVVRGMEA